MKVKSIDPLLRNLGFITAGLFFVLGRYPISWLLSSKRKKRPLENVLPGTYQYIRCPSGNTLYVEFDGLRDAQPLVFLHGLNSSRLQWNYQRLFFRDKYRLIFIDLPGHGKSSKPANLSIPLMAADLNTVLRQLAVKTPILYGHSLGGMIVMDYCVNNYNSAVKGVILQSCSFTNPLKTCLFPVLMQLLQEPVLRPYLNFVKKHPLFFTVLGRINYLNGLSLIFYRYLLFKGGQTAEQLRYLCKIAALCPPEVTAEGLLKTLEFNVDLRLQRITAPCLVLAGAEDRIVTPQASAYITRQVHDGQLKIVNGGHLGLIEQDEKLNGVLNNFLLRIG